MKNVHVVPTEKPSRLILRKDNKFILRTPITQWHGKNQNIYITSDEEIKEGDWFLDDNNSMNQSHKLSHVQFANPKKIILTTDFDKQPRVQAIDDEFLEWFVKNPSCEEVEVEKEIFKLVHNPSYIDYTPEGDGIYLTPKSEDLQYGETLIEDNVFNYKIIIPKEEAKQETLEEAADKASLLEFPIKEWYRSDDYNREEITAARDGFKRGAKWQQKNSYSEDDLREAFEWGVAHITFEEWLKKFKKK